ncbi:DUF3307 domain-containing protein [Clostridium polynesiense]|uniref:DUF3307 domain-containing protein n=1 Tax=Clostridium polynesiense TaxID=1325933 RepID=UPI00058C1F36|nr:DUF3307 domain-containing protein [Clostridium polynesiense]
MFKEYFVLLLLVHVLGDYYFQTSFMARKKDKSVKWVFIHFICFWLTTVIIMVPLLFWKVLFIGTIYAAIHGVIDLLKYYYIKNQKGLSIIKDRNLFLLDQMIHMISLVVISYILTVNYPPIYVDYYHISINLKIQDFFHIIGIPVMTFVSWVTALLLITKPANITISKLLAAYRPDNKDEESKKDKNAGRFIGTMERILILIFISIGQYSAIGLVLTAKSIARYDRISKERDFAEYYLLGTLISTAFVIVAGFLI